MDGLVPLATPEEPTVLQPVLAGVVGAITGFAGSFTIVLTGLLAVGATPTQAASGLLALCFAQATLTIVFGLKYRMPVTFAWSTPGAALLIAAHRLAPSFATVVGAFLLSAVLLLLTGLWPPLARAMTRIPQPMSGALLAGILFPICLVPVTTSFSRPLLALPIVAVWLVLYRFATRWAVPAALVVAIGVMAISGSAGALADAHWLPSLDLQAPAFQPVVLLGIGVPLYLVTMASQNVPGIAMLTTFGYDRAPTRAALAWSGAATLVTAPFGGHAVNLAALSAAITAGPDAHPDPSRRWPSAVSNGITYIVLGLLAGVAASFVGTSSPVLIEAVAGLALLGALITGLASAFTSADGRVAAAITFLVVASGVSVAGIGSAFWGLLAGGAVYLLLRPRAPKLAA